MADLLLRPSGAAYASPAALAALDAHGPALHAIAADLRGLAEALAADGFAVRAIHLTATRSLHVDLMEATR